jgi:hypothetical protein
MSQMTRRGFGALAAGVPALGWAAQQGSEEELPFRQVHLDFHTSELIPDVGLEFDAGEFASTLRAARVNSINVFAKCHHGYAYYDTQIATRHPALKFDLLGRMVQACRAEGIHVLYYYSLVWDVLTSRKHPEWMVVTREGGRIGGPPSDQWPWMCMNTPYLDQVIAENRELVSKYAVKGAWFDILKQNPDGCFCQWCRAERQKLGLKDDAEGVRRHNKLVAKRVEARLNEVVHAKIPAGLTFYNSRLVVGVRDELDAYSHIEIESLPTGGWGYTHFQQRVRYMRTLGKQMVGMTGRFHKSWGDFGGLKNQAALDFECLNFVANGAKCCVGDQLHPRGRLDRTTYERIGRTYAKIEALEPWATATQAVAEIGVISTALFNRESTQRITPADQGFTNMLVELHQQFNVLDLEEDFGKYRLLILPDEIRPSKALLEKLDAYVAGGGAVIVSGESLLDPARRWFDWKPLGVRYQGPAQYKGEYLVAKQGAFPSLDEAAYFLYQPGHSVAAEEGTEVLATYGHPYFDRSPAHFSSHKQTPMGQRTEQPVVTVRGKVAYIANPVFRSYALDGVGAYKVMVGDLIRRLMGRAVLECPALPSTAQATVLEQPGKGRTVVHLLHYPMTRRAPDIDVIEEPGVLLEQEIRLRMGRAPRRVTLVPQNKTLAFRFEDGTALCRVERIAGHQAICFE